MFDIDAILDAIGASEWEAGPYGDTLIAPCGCEIETDGRCECGNVSPLRMAGLI